MEVEETVGSMCRASGRYGRTFTDEQWDDELVLRISFVAILRGSV